MGIEQKTAADNLLAAEQVAELFYACMSHVSTEKLAN